MTHASKVSDFSLKLKENPVRSVFIFVLIVSVILALAQLYKSYLISTGYDRPVPLMAFPIVFQHVSFALVPLLFAFTWRLGKKHKARQVLFSTIGLLIFAFTYLFISNALEWYAIQPDYGIWDSYPFVLQHSGPGVLIVYLAIAAVMTLLGMEKTTFLNPPPYLQRIAVRNRHKNFHIDVGSILFIEASDNYISIHTEEEHPELVRQTIGSIEKQLDPSHFQRIHRSHIINLKKVKSWEADPNGGYLLNLPGGHQLKMSKSYKNKLELLSAQY
jgi:hypothetical protein